LGMPVVPLVYMMVHRSSLLAGLASAGCCCPRARNSSKLYTFIPWEVALCTPPIIGYCQYTNPDTKAGIRGPCLMLWNFPVASAAATAA
jgi:hypothetical protein